MRTIVRIMVLLVLLFFATFLAYSDENQQSSLGTWGLTAQVSNYGPAVGALFHIGDHFIIRPALFTTSTLHGGTLADGVFADFLYSIRAGSDFLWYVGLALAEFIDVVMDTGAVDLSIEVAAILGVQAMITERLGLYTDFGIRFGGQINVTDGQGSFDYIDFRSSGVGAVFYLN